VRAAGTVGIPNFYFDSQTKSSRMLDVRAVAKRRHLDFIGLYGATQVPSDRELQAFQE
jgi:hypothetical protein